MLSATGPNQLFQVLSVIIQLTKCSHAPSSLFQRPLLLSKCSALYLWICSSTKNLTAVCEIPALAPYMFTTVESTENLLLETESLCPREREREEKDREEKLIVQEESSFGHVIGISFSKLILSYCFLDYL